MVVDWIAQELNVLYDNGSLNRLLKMLNSNNTDGVKSYIAAEIDDIEDSISASTGLGDVYVTNLIHRKNRLETIYHKINYIMEE